VTDSADTPTAAPPPRPTSREAEGGGGALARELVSRLGDDLRRRSGFQAPSPARLAAFCDSLIDAHPGLAAETLSGLQARGVSVDALYGGWLAGAAMELGRRWDEDEVSFADVALGMTRLQRLLRELGPAYVGPGRGGSGAAPLAFVAAAPGERHIFGPVMFADHLRRLGWQVRLDVSGDRAATVAAVAAARPAAIGVSAGSRAVTSELSRMLQELRRAAPGAPVVLGGALAAEDPETAATLGADALARTAQEFESAARRAPQETRSVRSAAS